MESESLTWTVIMIATCTSRDVRPLPGRAAGARGASVEVAMGPWSPHENKTRAVATGLPVSRPAASGRAARARRAVQHLTPSRSQPSYGSSFISESTIHYP